MPEYVVKKIRTSDGKVHKVKVPSNKIEQALDDFVADYDAAINVTATPTSAPSFMGMNQPPSVNDAAAFQASQIPPNRMQEFLQTAGEGTGLPAAFRIAESVTQQRKMPQTMDIVQSALMAGGAGLAKFAGATGLGIAKAIGGAALGAGAGQAALGPEARTLAQSIREGSPQTLSGMVTGESPKPSFMRNVAAAGVEMAPSVAGSILAPMAASRAMGGVRSLMAPKPAPVFVPEGMPAPAPMVAPVAEAIPKLSPAQALEAANIEKSFLGGRKLTAGQAQELAAPGQKTMAKGFEFRVNRTASGIKDASEKLGAIQQKLQQLAESQAPGASKTSTRLAGQQLADSYTDMIKNAGGAIDDAEVALKELPGLNKVREGFREPIQAELKNLAKEFRLEGKLVSRVPKDEKRFYQEVVNEAKKIGSVQDLIEFRRWVRGEISNAQKKLAGGTGEFTDYLEQRIYQATDDAIAKIKMPAAERAALDQFLEASGNYKRVKFSNEAKWVKDAIGFKSKDVPLDKTGEQIAKSIFGGGKNVSGKLEEAIKAGLIDRGQLQKAAWAEFFDRVKTGEGALDDRALRKTIDSLSDTDKEFLFGKGAATLTKAADVADLVTYAKRYMPMTGAALPDLAPSFFGSPMGASVASSAYYKVPGAQRLLAPEVLQSAPIPGRASFFQGASMGTAGSRQQQEQNAVTAARAQALRQMGVGAR